MAFCDKKNNNNTNAAQSTFIKINKLFEDKVYNMEYCCIEKQKTKLCLSVVKATIVQPFLSNPLRGT